MRITILGSASEANLPEDFPSFFKEGVLVSRKFGKPHELDAYSLYLGLRALEFRFNLNYSELRAKIVDALLVRRENCGGFWTHQHWSGNQVATGLRSTSAAIRLLIEAYVDGLINNKSLIISCLHKHLTYKECLENGGFWLFHDSWEALEPASLPPWKLFKAQIWGSSPQNTLALNSHVDTLVTILHLLMSVDNLDDEDQHLLTETLDAGLEALSYVLEPTVGVIPSLYQALDSFARRQYFNSYDVSYLSTGWFWRQLFFRYFAHLHPYLKARFPSFQYKDGFMPRDLRLGGLHFDYHIVNIWDLARLASLLERHNYKKELAVRLHNVTFKGLEYAFSPTYFKFVEALCKRSSSAIELCETLYTYYQQGKLLDKVWIQKYITIRRLLSPTPALLGYDPVIVPRSLRNQTGKIEEFGLGGQAVDILILTAGRYLLINYGHVDCVLSSPLFQHYSLVWSSDPHQTTQRIPTLPQGSALIMEQCNEDFKHKTINGIS